MTTMTCPRCGPAQPIVELWLISEPWPGFDVEASQEYCRMLDAGESEECLFCVVCGYHEAVPVDRQLAESGATRLPGL